MRFGIIACTSVAVIMALAPLPLARAQTPAEFYKATKGQQKLCAARFDESCVSKDSAPNAPEAGQWFDAYALELVKNANPPL